MQNSYRYNPEKRDFDVMKEEIVTIAEFGIEIKDKKLLVFGNKWMAQRIITLLGTVLENAYSITEFVIDIEKLVRGMCKKKQCCVSQDEIDRYNY